MARVEGAPLGATKGTSWGTAEGTSGGTASVPSAVLGTALYLASALMLFAGFVSAHVVLRGSAPQWPPAGQPRLPLAVTGANTVVLLASGVATLLAARAREGRAAARWLARAAALGGLFLLIQGAEWIRLLRFGMLARPGPYGGTFYTLVGTHAAHAAGGFVALATAAHRGDRLGGGRLAATALYWGFVVLVWPAIYALVFLG